MAINITGTRTSKGDIIALANGATIKGARVTVTLPGGETTTGTVTSTRFHAKFGDYRGRLVIFVRQDGAPAPRTRTARTRRNRFEPAGGRCGAIFYRTAWEHEQDCNNPSCPGD